MPKKKRTSESRPPAKREPAAVAPSVTADFHLEDLRTGLSALLDEGRRQAVRAVNVILTATYWEVGRRSEYRCRMQQDWFALIPVTASEVDVTSGEGFQ
jgi:hypothetical protein